MFFPTSFLSRYYFSNKRAIILKQNKNQIITQTVKNKQKNKTKPCYHILLFPKCRDVRRDPCCDCLPDHLEPLLAIISSSCLNMLFKQGIKMLENSNFTPTFDIFKIIPKLSGGTLEFSKTFWKHNNVFNQPDSKTRNISICPHIYQNVQHSILST